MNIKNIIMDDKNKLLEKYWNGETTLEEERRLKETIPNDKTELSTKTMFSFFENEKKIKFEKDFSHMENENLSSTTPENKVIKLNYVRKLAVAASIVLLIAIGTLLNNNYFKESNNQFAKYEINDPQEARDITEKALAMLAVNYNKGEVTVMENIKNLDKINIVNTNR